METFRDNTVQIFGYLPPKTDGKQIKWVLSVQEDLRSGSVDTFPTFQPTEEEEEREVRSALYERVYIRKLHKPIHRQCLRETLLAAASDRISAHNHYNIGRCTTN